MDRNQIIGILLIAVILIGYSIYTKPSKEELEIQRQEQIVQDSLYKVGLEKEKQKAVELANNENQAINGEQIGPIDTNLVDSAEVLKIKETYGSFGESAIGQRKFITIENDLIKMTISTKGGRPYSVQLKNYMN